MATSQMIAAATSGRYMSALAKSVRPALKLMKVLTTATEASEMPMAAGIPSSRTRPDVCRMKRRPASPPAVAVPAAASLLATAYLQGLPASAKRGGITGERPAHLRDPARLPLWFSPDKSLSIPTNILLFPQIWRILVMHWRWVPAAVSGSRGRAVRAGTGAPRGRHGPSGSPSQRQLPPHQFRPTAPALSGVCDRLRQRPDSCVAVGVDGHDQRRSGAR